LKSLFTLVCVFLGLAAVSHAQTADLFISEYVEGSGYNKALEIFNGTDDAINLGDYALERYNNGATDATIIPLDTMDLGPGQVFVITNNSADPALLATADQTSSEINFNGNDTIVLVRNGWVIDSFGQIGFDPGSAWVCDGGSTINSTLRRMASFCTGDTNPADEFNPCLTFEFFPGDSFDGLGSHESDCVSVGNGAMSWGSFKAQYR